MAGPRPDASLRPARQTPEPAPAARLASVGSDGQWRLEVAAPGLGPLRIDLGLHGHGLDARFWVRDASAAATLQGGFGELRGSLAAGGLSLGQLGVALGSGGRDSDRPDPGTRRRVEVSGASSSAAGPARPRGLGVVDILA